MERIGEWMAAAARAAGRPERTERRACRPEQTRTLWSSIPMPRGPSPPSDLHFRHKLSPYLGAKLRGRVLETWLRGEQIFAAGGNSSASRAAESWCADERPRPATRHCRVPAHRRHDRGAGPHHAPLSHPAHARCSCPFARPHGSAGHERSISMRRATCAGSGSLPAASNKRLLLGSHIDTVPDAGAFDGVLGVTLALEWVDIAQELDLPLAIEVIAFSEEEGVRFWRSLPRQPRGCRPLRSCAADSQRCRRRHDGSGDPRLRARSRPHRRSSARRQMQSALSRCTSSRARCSKPKA